MHKLFEINKKTQLSIVVRGGLFLFIWWTLVNGDVLSWWLGLPAVVLATIVSIALIPPSTLVLRRLVYFMPYFLIHSFRGALDVAWRVFHPRLPIKPDFVEYPLSLPPGLSQFFMINLVSLVPGTLTAELKNNVLSVHVLDSEKKVQAELSQLEQKVAEIFNLTQKNNTGDKYHATV